MRNYLTLTLLALFLLTFQTTVNAQPDSVWSRTYGGESTESCLSIIQTHDNGFALTGISSMRAGTRWDFGLVRTDQNGNELWARSYGTDSMDYCNDVVECDDGGFLLIGPTEYFEAGGSNLLIVRTDTEGDSLWATILGWPGFERCNAVIRTSDGGYAIGGSNTFNHSMNFWLVKLESDGDTLWTKSYGREDRQEECFVLLETEDADLVLAGNTYMPGPPEHDFMIIKTNLDGDSLWSKTFGGDDTEYCRDMIQTHDGGFALSGVTFSLCEGNNCFWLVRTDSAGDSLWTRAYSGEYLSDCNSIIETSDRGLAMAGYGSGAQSLLRLTSEGDSLWTFTSFEEYGARCNKVIQTEDRGFVLAGEIMSLDGNYNQDFLLVKSSPDPVSVSDPNFIHHPSSFILSSFPSPFNSSTFVSFQTPFSGVARASLTDIAGREVRGWIPAFAGMRDAQRFTVDGAGLSAGTYWLKVEQGGRIATTRLVLVK